LRPLIGLGLDDVALGDKVGQGVSGHVFRATTNRTGAPVAVKVFPFAEADPALRPRERFWRECRILATVRHPAFPALYGCGEVDEGTAFAIMEWIEGRPLDEYRTAPHDVVLGMAARILQGLRALHAAGYIHRDIAFDNFIVEQRRWGPNPRIIDLGAAKDVQDDLEVTHPGSFLGRLAFASPESLTSHGSAAVSDPKADVFSFGALLYEWLSGKPPFPGQAPSEVFRSQQKPLPERIPVTSGRRPLDQATEAYVLGLLQRDPALRPPTEAALRDLLALKRRAPVSRHVTGSSPEELLANPEAEVLLVKPETFPPRPRVRALSSFPVGLGRVIPPDVGDEAAADLTPPETVGEPAARDFQAPPPGTSLLGELASHPVGGKLFLAIGVLTFVAACILTFLLVFGKK
jgi:serine/threonine protein kinase